MVVTKKEFAEKLNKLFLTAFERDGFKIKDNYLYKEVDSFIHKLCFVLSKKIIILFYI